MSEIISIIIPVYNTEPYIARCLDSILAQTHRDIEVIAVDDGSTDRSGMILDEYAARDARVRVIHKENGGVSTARAAGLAAASGAYIGFVDGDDEIEADMYARLLGNLKQYDADISHCGHRVVHIDGTEEFFYNTGKLEQHDRQRGIQVLLAGEIEPGLCNKLYKASLWKTIQNNGTMATDIRINEDLLLNFYTFNEASTMVYEDVCLYHYMKRDGSASRSPLNYYRIHDPLTVKHRILEVCQGTALEIDARAALLNTYINVYNSLLAPDGVRFKEDRQYTRKEIAARLCDVGLLVKRRQLFARMIAKTPWLYRVIYRIFG